MPGGLMPLIRRRLRPFAANWSAGNGGVGGNNYLFIDQFSTDKAGGSVDATAMEPGPGTRSVIDANDKLSISGGKLVITSDTGNNARILYHVEDLSLAPGIAFITKIDSVTTRVDMCNSTALDDELKDKGGIEIGPAILSCRGPSGQSANLLLDAVTFPNYIAHIRSGSGGSGEVIGLYVVGGKLVWVSSLDEYSAVVGYPFIGVNNLSGCAGTFDWFLGTQLGSPWAARDGVATTVVDAPVADEEIAMESDALVEFTWTVGAAETLDIWVRRVDADNGWIVRCDQAGGKIYLYEKVGGVETERGAAGGVAQTWTPATDYRIVITCFSSTIKVYVWYGNPKISYTSATGFQGYRVAKASGFAAGSRFAAWPHQLSGAALSAISSVLPSNSLIAGLLSYWKLDEFGWKRFDSVGLNHLTELGEVPYGPGKLGNGAGPTSSGNELYCAKNNLILGTQDFSVSYWFKLTDLTLGSAILSLMTDNSNQDWSTGYSQSATKFNFDIVDSGGTTHSLYHNTFGTLSTGTWYHVVIRHRDSDHFLSISVNGNVQDFAAPSGGAAQPRNTCTEFHVGRKLTGYVNGIVDSVACWNRLLSSTEIASLYNSGSGFEYPFNGELPIEGTEWYDGSSGWFIAP